MERNERASPKSWHQNFINDIVTTVHFENKPFYVSRLDSGKEFEFKSSHGTCDWSYKQDGCKLRVRK